MFETTLPTQHAMRQVAKSTPAAPKGEKMSTTTFACERRGRSRWRISTRLRGGGEGEHSSTDIVAVETMTNNSSSNNNNNDNDDDDNDEEERGKTSIVGGALENPGRARLYLYENFSHA